MQSQLELFILLLLFTAVSCNPSKQDKKSKAQETVLSVEGLVVKTKAFSDQVALIADILPSKDLEIKSPISGILLEYNFAEGQQVKEGDLLVRLDDRRSRIQLQAMEAEQKILLSELQRKQALQEIEAISIEELEHIQDRIIIIEAEIKTLNLAIEMANIIAPFNGQIGMMDWTEGSYINQGETITKLVQNEQLKVNLQIPGSYADNIKTGDSILVKAYGDSVRAVVYAISPVMDTYSRTLQVRAVFNRTNQTRFVPGTFAEVALPVNLNLNAIVVPSKSILYDINEQTVYTLKQGKVHKQVVKTGVIGSEEVEITEGLMAGDTLLTSGLLKLKEGMSVNVIF